MSPLPPATPVHPAEFARMVWIALAVVIGTVFAIIRGVEVRLTLLLASLTLGAMVRQTDAILRKFLDTLSDEKYVLPICSAMGFAYVIRHCGCDAHLVRLLIVPIRRLRSLAIPGVALVAFSVNIPVISQTSTAVCVGPVAIPLLRAAGFTPLACAATLCLGASLGGELLNPGAPELQTVTKSTHTPATEISREYIPGMLFPYVAAAILVHWLLTRWLERGVAGSAEPAAAEPINVIKALVPVVPLIFLFLTGPPWFAINIPRHWLADDVKKFDTRLIAVAMLLGVALAALTTPGKAKDSMKQFFEGCGYGLTAVVSLIVTANCFGEAIRLAGLADAIGQFIGDNPALLVPLAVVTPWFFAFVSGSGIASTQSLYGFFHTPAVDLGENPDRIGACVSVGSAAGRTMSPVAAVVLMSASLTGTRPFQIVNRLVIPLAAGLSVAVVLRMLNLT